MKMPSLPLNLFALFVMEVQVDVRQANDVQLSIGAIINIKNSETSTLSSSDENGSIATENNKNNECTKWFSKLPLPLDPNIGLIGYLPPLNISYNADMCQPWNIAPYFLDMLPQSSLHNKEDCILLYGGINPSDPDDFVLGCSIFEFQIKSKFWHYYGCMMEPRCYHATASIETFIYVTGGYSPLQRSNGEMLAIPYTDRLDLKSTLWKRCAPMNVARAAHVMVAVGSHLYVFGGRDSSGNILASVEAYDTLVDEWTIISQLPHPTMGSSVTFVEGNVWVIGGITKQQSEHPDECIVANVFCFSLSNYSWSLETPLPIACSFSHCVSSKDSVWVVGGSFLSNGLGSNTLKSSPCVWHMSLCSTSRTWKMAGTLSLATHASSAVLYGDSLLVFGGIHSEEGVGEVVQLFNTVTKECKLISSLPSAIAGLSAVFLAKQKGKEKMKCIIHLSKCASKDSVQKISRTKRQHKICSKKPSMHLVTNEIQAQYLPKLKTKSSNSKPPKVNSEALTIQLDVASHQGKNDNSSLDPGHEKQTIRKHKLSLGEMSKDTEPHSFDAYLIQPLNVIEKYNYFVDGKKSQINNFINYENKALAHSSKSCIAPQKQAARKQNSAIKDKSKDTELLSRNACSIHPKNITDKLDSVIDDKHPQLYSYISSKNKPLNHPNNHFGDHYEKQATWKKESAFKDKSKDTELHFPNANSLHPKNMTDKLKPLIEDKQSLLNTLTSSENKALKHSNKNLVGHKKQKSTLKDIRKDVELHSFEASSQYPINVTDKSKSLIEDKHYQLNTFFGIEVGAHTHSAENASTSEFDPKATYDTSFNQLKWSLSEGDLFHTTDKTSKAHLIVQDEYSSQSMPSNTEIVISKYPSNEVIDDTDSTTSSLLNSGEETFPNPLTSQNLSQEANISKLLHDEKPYKVTEMFLPDLSASHDHYHQKRYVTTLVIPINGEGNQRIFELKPDFSLKTGMVLQSKKWKQVVKCMSDSSCYIQEKIGLN